MSGRIYDVGVNPICNICGSKMWTSYDRNFNGVKCKRKGCNGDAIYEKTIFSNESVNPKNVYKDSGVYILEGALIDFNKPKSKYTISERLRNFIYTLFH